MKVAALKLNFDDLFSLKQFSDVIRDRHVAALAKFHDPDSGGFRHSSASKNKPDISMSSTATSVVSLVESGIWKKSSDPDWVKDYPWLTQTPFWASKALDYIERLLKQEWTSAGLVINNAFTVGFVVEACACLVSEASFDSIKDKQVQKIEQKVPHGTDVMLPTKTL